jgi:rubrerythrin
MSFNPFDEKPRDLESLYTDWQKMYSKPYDKYEVDPYTKVRCILMNGTEFEAAWFTHQFFRHCPDNDIRRELSAVRRGEQQEQKRIATIKPLNESILETTIGYEQLAVDLTAILARREKNPYVKRALDFALLEDFDHLYRYADLLDLEQGIHAERLVGSYTEIMPGRPTISEHRHPFDDVKRPVNYQTAEGMTKLDIGIIVAAEQQTMNYYMNQVGFYPTDAGRELYAEIAMIEEQHVTHYGSLIDVNEGWLECWLNHEYTECYLYYSCYKDETDPSVKRVWEEHLLIEIAHLHKAADILKRVTGKEWNEVVKDGNFPELLSFKPQKEYVRDILKNTATLTGEAEDYAEVNNLGDGSLFFKYQNAVNDDAAYVPSHSVIDRYIDEFGKDYRYEIAENPRTELRDRQQDNISLGRCKQKIKASAK